MTPDRFDLSTFKGRLLHFTHIVDPFTLLISDTELKNAKRIVHADQNPVRNAHHTATSREEGVTREEVWRARKVVNSVLHPDTEEPIPRLFRRSAFVPVNMPIFLGMLFSPQTKGWIVFWQWFNQSYNCGMNYTNRNASNKQTTMDIAKTYALATLTSSSAGVAMKMVVDKMPTPQTLVGKALARGIIPLVAVVSAGSLNVFLTRFNEVKDGVDVRVGPNTGETVGKSQIAGRDGIWKTLVSRALLPIPTLILPPIALGVVDAMRATPLRGWKKVAAQTTIVGLCLTIALPLSLAPFPQFVPLKASELERDIAEISRNRGVDVVYYNRGL